MEKEIAENNDMVFNLVKIFKSVGTRIGKDGVDPHNFDTEVMYLSVNLEKLYDTGEIDKVDKAGIKIYEEELLTKSKKTLKIIHAQYGNLDLTLKVIEI